MLGAPRAASISHVASASRISQPHLCAAQNAAELAALTPSLISEPLPLRVAYARSLEMAVSCALSAGSPGEKQMPLFVRVISQAYPFTGRLSYVSWRGVGGEPIVRSNLIQRNAHGMGTLTVQ